MPVPALVAIDRFPIIEGDVKRPGLYTFALQRHVNPLHIPFSPISDGKAQPHRSLLTIRAREITAIQTELPEVRLVKVGKIVQRVHAVLFFGFALPELEMQMGIGRVFLTHRADHVALVHVGAWNHPLGDAVEMEIDKEQIILAVRRIDDFEDDMR